MKCNLAHPSARNDCCIGVRTSHFDVLLLIAVVLPSGLVISAKTHVILSAFLSKQKKR